MLIADIIGTRKTSGVQTALPEVPKVHREGWCGRGREQSEFLGGEQGIVKKKSSECQFAPADCRPIGG
jgi:hypothetical protein